MRPQLTIQVVIIAVLLNTAGPAVAETRIATVDVNKVLAGYHKTKQAEELLRVHRQDLEKTQQSIVEQCKKAREDYQKALDDSNNQAVSLAERERCKKAAEAKLAEVREGESNLGEYNRKAQITLEEQKRHAMDSLLAEIRAVIAARAKAAHYTVVLDSSTEGAAAVSLLFADPETDITQEILKQLNSASLPAPGRDYGK